MLLTDDNHVITVRMIMRPGAAGQFLARRAVRMFLELMHSVSLRYYR